MGDDDEEEDEEEGEIVSYRHSLPPENLHSLGDLFGQQAGISVGAQRLKRPQMDARGGPSTPPQLSLVVVCSVLKACLHWWCKDNSLTWRLVGSVALTDRRSRCICDGGAVLIEHRGCGTLVQGGLLLVFPADVLPVRMCY
jgi:hypothetical protein